MNIALSLKSVVHSADRTGCTPACGAGNRTSYFSDTDRAVSCKRCLKILADQEERAARTAYYAGLSDAQDMDLSQADDRADDVKEEAPAAPACTCPADERAKSGTDNHYIECPQAPAPQPQREADPRTGLPVVTVDDVKYVVGFVQPGDDYSPDYVDFWLVSHAVGFSNIWRAYADSARGSVARKVWDAQSTLRERNR